MTFRFARMLFALAAPLLLASCLTPGRFTATLEINRDRSFTFTYVGEAVVADPSAGIQMTMQGAEGAPPPSSEQPQEMPEGDRQRIIEALSREVGFRSVEYVGQNKFRIDYAISGRLDRSFVFPMNPEGMAILPWLLVEVRRDGTAQVTGSGFGDGMGNAGDPTTPETNRDRQGTFTLVTDADLVQHNSEDAPAADGRTTLTWEVTPEARPAPTALLRFAG